MKRKLVFGLAILALIPVIGCQRLERLPQVIANRTGLSQPDAAPASRPNTQSTMNSQGSGGAVGQLQTMSVNVGGQDRTYYVYAPSAARSGQPLPMVMAFHGGGGGAAQFASRMGLVNMAETYGLVIVLPQGAGRPGARNAQNGSWNADSITPSGYAENNGVNDLGFVEALMDVVPSRYAIDRSRIYAMGFSKGGMMAYRAACVKGSRITAIAAVSATLSSADCPNPQGVSLLHIHGTDDENVPLNGGVGQFTAGRADWPPVNRGLQYFTSGNQCAGQTQTRISNDTTCSVNDCAGNEEVQLCLVQGGGHAWPGAQPANWQVKHNVFVTQSFSATDYIARFFQSQ